MGQIRKERNIEGNCRHNTATITLVNFMPGHLKCMKNREHAKEYHSLEHGLYPCISSSCAMLSELSNTLVELKEYQIFLVIAKTIRNQS